MKKVICTVCFCVLFSAALPAQALSDLPENVAANAFLEDAFALVNAPEYFSILKTGMDDLIGFSAMVDVQSRWVRQNFIVRSTDMNGNQMYGDAADGIISGTAIRERLAFLLGVGDAKVFAIRAGVMFDYVFASHLGSWFEALAGDDLFTGGGKTGFSAYAFVLGPVVNVRLFGLVDLTYMAWLKQSHPYDASGAFLSTWIPHYTGNEDNSDDSNYLEPWSGGDLGDYSATPYWPADRVPYKRVFDQVFMARIWEFNLNSVLSQENGLAALRLGMSLVDILQEVLPRELFAGLKAGGEYVQGQYNFNNKKDAGNFVLEPVFLLGGGKEMFFFLATNLSLQVWEPNFNNVRVEFHAGSTPDAVSTQLKQELKRGFPLYGIVGLNAFRWRDNQVYAGYLARIGVDLNTISDGRGIGASLELGISYNYESELKKAISRRNEVIVDFSLRTKVGF